MCLPYRCLRILLIVTCVALCGAGAVVIWAGYKVSEMQPLKSEDLEFIGYIIIAFGAALAGTGLLGLTAACLKSRCLLSIFATLALLIGVGLAVLGAGLLYGREKVGDILKTEEDCADSSEFKDANNAVEDADSLICTDECPCDMDADLAQQYLLAGVVVTLGSADTIENCDPCSTFGSVNDNDCESSDEIVDRYFSNDEQGYFTLLKWMEEKFDCSGICYPGTFYLFSDVNNGKPDESCMDSVKDWLEEQLLLYGTITLLSGLALLFAVVLAYCMTCNPFYRGKG